MWIPIAFGLLLASIDVFAMGTLKKISTGDIPNTWKNLAIPVGIYATTPLIFLQSLNYEAMTVMNLMWDMTSDILVSIMGIFYFREQLSYTKTLGIVFSFIAIFLLTYEN
jgi:multidrug transporter EmrE-like cation transporter